MFAFPQTMQPLIGRFSTAFTRLAFKRFMLLMAGALLAPGRRTVTHGLWTVRSLMDLGKI